jgi:putative Mg2+ transporter-C (MgtC) family protein
MTEIGFLTTIIPQMLIAAICGFIIGWEREIKNKVAGIRTHILICVGACLYTTIGVHMGELFKVDPTRIIGQIVTGIGFLGAGVIYKHDDKVVGVTSAAFVWFVSSIGVLVGVGYMFSSFFLTVGLLITMLILERFEKKIKTKK